MESDTQQLKRTLLFAIDRLRTAERQAYGIEEIVNLAMLVEMKLDVLLNEVKLDAVKAENERLRALGDRLLKEHKEQAALVALAATITDGEA